MRDESRYRYLALSCAYSCLEAAFASMAKHIGLSGKALDALARLPFDEKWRALFDQARKPVPAATEKRVVKRMLEMRNSYVHAFVGESTSLRRRRKEHVLVSRMAPTTKEMADFLEATASLVDKYSARLESEPFNFAVGSLASLRDATED